jgi:hypothetical protein
VCDQETLLYALIQELNIKLESLEKKFVVIEDRLFELSIDQMNREEGAREDYYAWGRKIIL